VEAERYEHHPLRVIEAVLLEVLYREFHESVLYLCA
jgi:hypothetical protein